MNSTHPLDRPLIWGGLFFFTVGWLSWLSQFVEPQCSMDAMYYHLLAKRVIEGSGFTEPFIWQLLKPYTEIVRPIDYWMPFGIVLYALAQSIHEPAGEIGLNILLWSLLSVWVFRQVLFRTSRAGVAWFGFLFFALGGKFAIYAVTTDNVVFYAVFGALFFSLFNAPATGTNSFFTGVIGGLMTLTRIEGIIFAAVGLVSKSLENRKAIFSGLLGLCLVLSPWVWRNSQEFGVWWPSFPRALFLHQYQQMYMVDSPKTLHEYMAPGFSWVLGQKLKALRANFREFFLTPTHLMFLPFWIVGIIGSWRTGGQTLFFFTMLFWFLNAFLFTTQSLLGTAFHTSAALFPSSTIAISLGLETLRQKYLSHWKKAPVLVLISVFQALVLGWTLFGTWTSSQNYQNDLKPFKYFLQQHPLPKGSIVGSSFPVGVHFLNGNPGIIMPSRPLPEIFPLADVFKCQYLVLIPHLHVASTSQETLVVPGGWSQICSTSAVLAFKKQKTESPGELLPPR